MAINDAKKRQFLDVLELTGLDSKKKLDSTFGDAIRGLFKLQEIREALRNKKKIYDTFYVNLIIKFGIKYPDNIYEKLDEMWDNLIRKVKEDGRNSLWRILDINDKFKTAELLLLPLWVFPIFSYLKSASFISDINIVWKEYKKETIEYAKELLKDQ